MTYTTDWNMLVQRSIGGEESAFDELYSTIYPIVEKFIEIKFGQVSFAQDIVSETLIKVWKNLELFNESKARFLSWVLKIAYNTAVDFVRRQKRLTLLPIEAALSVADENSTETGLCEIDRQLLRKELKKIPEQNRRVVLQRLYKEMTNEQISSADEIKLGTVKSRYRLGLDYLRTQIRGEREDWI